MKRIPRPLKVVAALFAFYVGYRWFFGAPSEAQMLQNFRAHRREFEELRAMLQQDTRVGGVHPNGLKVYEAMRFDRNGQFKGGGENTTDLRKVGLTPLRLMRYQGLLRAIGNHSAFYNRQKNAVRIGVFGGGFGGDTWGIGYAWTATPPENLVASAYREYKTCYSRIDGNWYLYQRR